MSESSFLNGSWLLKSENLKRIDTWWVAVQHEQLCWLQKQQVSGLLDANIPIDYQNYGKLQLFLKVLEKWNPSMEDFDDGMDELTSPCKVTAWSSQNDLNEIKRKS